MWIPGLLPITPPKFLRWFPKNYIFSQMHQLSCYLGRHKHRMRKKMTKRLKAMENTISWTRGWFCPGTLVRCGNSCHTLLWKPPHGPRKARWWYIPNLNMVIYQSVLSTLDSGTWLFHDINHVGTQDMMNRLLGNLKRYPGNFLGLILPKRT